MGDDRTTGQLRDETYSLIHDATGQAENYDATLMVEGLEPQKALSDAVLKLCHAASAMDERLRRLER